jgi:ketosteroid isomerase-like protein
MATSEVDLAIEQNHRALDQFVKGNPEPLKELFSHRDHVSLANPFGLPVRGWKQVAETMERAASHYKDGEVISFDPVMRYETPGLAYTVEVERYKAKVGGGNDVVPVAVRVTTIFRPEDGTWKIVHRHADPITSARPAESVVGRE